MPSRTFGHTLATMTVALVTAVAGCDDAHEVAFDPPIAMSEMTGIWQTTGYGYVIEVTSEEFTVYDVTRDRCVENMSGPAPFIDALLTDASRAVEDRSAARMRVAGAVKYIAMTSLDAIPARCAAAEETSDPEVSFDAFFRTFEEQYAFFTERNVDWQALYDRIRPTITADTTEEALLEAFSEMLAPLEDGHVFLSTGEEDIDSPRNNRLFAQLTEELADHPEYESIFELAYVYREAHLELIGEHYLDGNVRSAANDEIAWGRLRDDVGYLVIHSMSGFAGDDASYEDEWSALDAALDEALTALADVDRLVVDVRFNGGGYDYAQSLIARRFADRRRLAFTTSVRTDGGYSEAQRTFVEPGGDVRFDGPVTLLVSPLTVSAAETFVLSMRVLPKVTVVGEATAGTLSDVLPKRLPNGWVFGLSTERYVAADGECYEARGIPPETESLLWLPEDRANGRDPMLDQVLAE